MPALAGADDVERRRRRPTASVPHRRLLGSGTRRSKVTPAVGRAGEVVCRPHAAEGRVPGGVDVAVADAAGAVDRHPLLVAAAGVDGPLQVMPPSVERKTSAAKLPPGDAEAVVVEVALRVDVEHRVGAEDAGLEDAGEGPGAAAVGRCTPSRPGGSCWRWCRTAASRSRSAIGRWGRRRSTARWRRRRRCCCRTRRRSPEPS